MSESQMQSEGIRAASVSLNRAQRRSIPKEITLSNGIVLKVKAMPPMLLNSVANSIPMPEVPKVYIEEKDREEENPNHPAYIKALAERMQKLTVATNNLILYACTEIEHIPDGLEKPTDKGWRVLAKMGGIEFDENDPIQCYLQWLNCYAMATADDINQCMTVPMMLAGITEAEVQDVMDTFRSGEERPADTEPSVEQPSLNGNHIQDTTTRGRGRPRRT